MKGREIVLISALAIGLYLLAGKGVTTLANQIQIGRPSIRVNRFNFQGLNLDLSIPVTNNTPAGVAIESFVGRLMYGTYKLADINMLEPVTITGNGVSTLMTRVDVSIADLGQNVVSLIENQDWLQSLRIVGTLRALNVNFPVDQSIRLI